MVEVDYNDNYDDFDMMIMTVVINNHLSGKKDGPEVNKEDVGGGGGVARPQDGDDVGDAQQWDDHLGLVS